MDLSGWVYVWAFVGSLLLTLLLTPLALRVARRFNVLDHPGSYKAQTSPVPYLGGIAVVFAFSAVIVAGAAVRAPPQGAGQLAIVVGIALGLSLVGLLDDLYGLHPIPRFAAQLGAGLGIWATGIQVEVFGASVPDLVLTLLWIVGITNAFNLLDNMDGLSAGLAAIAASAFFLLGAIYAQLAVAALAAALAGGALGFLKHNFHPARIYMGDAGSLFFGFMLAVIGIKLEFPAPPQVSFMVPVLVLGIAIVDTTLVVATRLAHRLNPFSGGRDHISHRLVFIGLSVRNAVILVYAGGISLAWLGVIMSRVDLTTGLMLMGLVVAVALFLGGMLALVPVYEHSRRRRIMLMEVVAHEARSSSE